MFREDLTDAEKSNLERNLGGGACFHWKGVIPFNGYDFYTSNETAFQNALLSEGKKAAVLKIWDDKTYGERLTEDQKKQLLLTKDQKQRIVDYCKQLYETGTPESTYVADSIMSIGLRHPVYKKYFEDNQKLGLDHFPKLDYQKEKDDTSYLGWGVGGAAAGAAAVGKIAGLSSVFGLPGLVAAGIGAGTVAGGKYAYDYFQKKLKKATYTEKNGPTLLKQVQNELDGKTLQKQQENTNTQSREKEQENARKNEEQRQKDEERRKNEERKKEEQQRKEQLKEEQQQRKEQLKEERQQRKEQLEEEKRQRKEQLEEEKRQKEDQKKKEKQQKEDSTQTKDIQLKTIDFSQKDANQSLTVKGKKGQVTTAPANLQNLNQNLSAIRQKITEETQNSANAPATVNASLENTKAFQAATAVKEQGSWWSRNWDIVAMIAGGLGVLGLGAWLIKKQKNKTKKAEAEASTLANQVSSLNSKVSSLTEALSAQSNQPATNTGTNTDTNAGTSTDTNTGTSTDTNTGTNTGTNTDTNAGTNTDTNSETNTGTNTETNTGTNTETGNGSTLENSGSSVPNDSSTDSSSVDKGRPVKIVIKGKTSSEME